MTIAEMNRTIGIMRDVYPFNDEDTEISTMRDPITGMMGYIELRTKAEDGTVVTLGRRYERSSFISESAEARKGLLTRAGDEGIGSCPIPGTD